MSTAPVPAPDPTVAPALAPLLAAAPRGSLGMGGTPPTVSSVPKKGYPYEPNDVIAAGLLIAGLLVIVGTGAATTLFGAKLGYTGGDAAASAGILFILSLIMKAPTLIMDDSPAAGGEPSTMRILTLAVVLTFCALALKTGWDKQGITRLQ